VKKIFIGKREISDRKRPLVIGEISANHNNSLETVYKLLLAAKKINLEFVKLQTFDVDEMTLNLRKGDFLIKQKFSNKKWNNRSLYDIYKEAHLPFDWHYKIFKKAKKLGVGIFSSVFDLKSLDLLEKLGCPAYKIASLESLHFPLIKAVTKTRKPLLISTGTLSIKEIDGLIKFLRSLKFKNYILLHCITNYPTKIEDTNLKTISYIKNKYKCLVGFSDHTSDTICANAAIANGANIIEKHYKLTKKDKGLDAQFSLDPKTMKKLIDETHKTWMSIGELKSDTLKNEIIYKKYRRSIYICKDVKKNQLINLSNVKVIRPGKGIEPKYLPKIIGKRFNKNLKSGTPLQLKFLKNFNV